MGLTKKRRKFLQKKIEKDYGYRRYHDDDIEVIDRGGKLGCGILAARQFLPGELVMEVRGQLIPRKKYEGSTYVMELDNKWYLEPAIPAAFVNHSCDPNTELVKITKHSLGFISICNIEAETEVTFDYQWEAKDWIPRCRCGSANCRGWVVGAPEVAKMEKIAKKKKKR
ncbi:MAG: SET domain-containing protein-lysine N-methyltransferase [Planctomycetota bacterium]